eukprot:6187648-Pleurochrysis_carterae.AAC.2
MTKRKPHPISPVPETTRKGANAPHVRLYGHPSKRRVHAVIRRPKRRKYSTSAVILYTTSIARLHTWPYSAVSSIACENMRQLKRQNADSILANGLQRSCFAVESNRKGEGSRVLMQFQLGHPVGVIPHNKCVVAAQLVR